MKPLDAQALYDEFGIESAPLFSAQERCFYEIPDVWADDIRQLITELRSYSPEIEFDQIKEKFGELRVYYRVPIDANFDRTTEIIEQCKDRLKEKGVYPLKE